MNKKHEGKKGLQKQLFAVIEMYKGQNGKEKRKLFGDFIREKLAEILLFGNDLSVKKRKQIKEAFVIDDIAKLQAVVLQPSALLAEELHKNPAIIQQLGDAGTV